jgi:hypothetical protein
LIGRFFAGIVVLQGVNAAEWSMQLRSESVAAKRSRPV